MVHKIIESLLTLTEFKHQPDGVPNSLTLHKKISPVKASNGKESPQTVSFHIKK